MDKVSPPNHAAGMALHRHDFDWNDLAFASKKPVSSLGATFIAAPRQLSAARFKQLIKEYLPQGNVVLGIAKEEYVDGLGPNPAFRMLTRDDVHAIVELVNKSSRTNRIYYLRYFQRDLPYVLEKLSFSHVVLVRGSWHTVFHGQRAYYILANRGTPYTYVSPFADEAEAQTYATNIEQQLSEEFAMPTTGSVKGNCDSNRTGAGSAKSNHANSGSNPSTYTADQMLTLADTAAKHSLDYTFQTGAVLGRKVLSSSSGKDEKYQFLAWSYNRVLPYQTYAMHHGNTREDNFSPPNDINHYDAIHAEMNLLVTAARHGIDLRGVTLFINLLPCPTCAKVLSQTDLDGIVYRHDHSAGYALNLFAATGKSTMLIQN